MQVDPEDVQGIAAEVVLQLVLDRDRHVSPLHFDAVEREVSIALRQSLLRQDALGRFGRFARELREEGFDARVRRYAGLVGRRGGTGLGILSVVEAVIAVLRRSPNVDQVCADDGTLLRKILLVIAKPSRARRNPFPPSGGTGSPPPGAGPAGGCPAEARVWDRPPRPRPPVEDLDRRERQQCRK